MLENLNFYFEKKRKENFGFTLRKNKLKIRNILKSYEKL